MKKGKKNRNSKYAQKYNPKAKGKNIDNHKKTSQKKNLQKNLHNKNKISKTLSDKNSKNKNKFQLLNTLKKFIKKVICILQIPSRIVWFWIIVISSMLIIYYFSAETQGIYKEKDVLEMSYEFIPSIEKTEKELSNLNIEYLSVQVQNGNEIKVEFTNLSQEQKNIVLEKFKQQAGVLDVKIYQIFPNDPISPYIYSLAGTSLVIFLGALCFILIKFRKKSLKYRLRFFVLFALISFLFFFASAAFGIVLSKIGLIGLNKVNYEIFVTVNIIFILFILYFLVIKNFRKSFMDMVYS